MNGRIQLKDMAFYGYHGNLAEESALGQRFLIDVVLWVDIAEAARTDNLHATVDYVKIFEVVREVVERERFKLLESLASRIIDRILESCTRANRVEITIKKPSPPMAGVLGYVAVETSKARA